MKTFLRVVLWFAVAVAFAMLPFATALSADRNTQSRAAYEKKYGVAATTQIYKGSMVCLDATGFLIPASDSSGISAVVGVADENVLGTTDGAIDCRVVSGRAFLFVATSITDAMHGTVMYVEDDQTVDDLAGVTNAIAAGFLLERVSNTSAWVFIPHGGTIVDIPVWTVTRTAEVTLTSAQIKALKATPIEIVAAPGANLAVVPVAINLVVNYGGSNVFTESADDLSIGYNSGAEIKEIESTGLIDQTNDEWRYITFEHAETFIPEENVAVEIINLDDEIAGNAGNDNTIALRLYYRLVPTDA